jgi:hypothetical protein
MIVGTPKDYYEMEDSFEKKVGVLHWETRNTESS